MNWKQLQDLSLKRFSKDFWSKKKCFMPIIVNIFDQSSDIGFIFGMFQLMRKEQNENECLNIDTTYLFILSLMFFLFYRITSGIMVYIGTRNIYYPFGQFLLEYMLIRAVWVNYTMKCKEPCTAIQCNTRNNYNISIISCNIMDL